MKRAHGFTLVELVAVIAITGLVAAALAVFLPPAFGAFAAQDTRARLAADADRALRSLRQELRTAVPNSVRSPGTQCLEFIPTSAGGRYRLGPDTVADSAPGCSPGPGCAAVLDSTGAATTAFDVLSPLASAPAVGDWVVVGNQNPGDVYGGANRAAITGVAVPAATQGLLRLSVAATAFAPGYDGGRFVVVPQAQQAVFYVCSGADGNLGAQGQGLGTLYRLAGYGFNAAAPAACPATTGAAVVASGVRRCRFVYDPAVGATPQNGQVSMEIELAQGGESVSLLLSAQVANTP